MLNAVPELSHRLSPDSGPLGQVVAGTTWSWDTIHARTTPSLRRRFFWLPESIDQENNRTLKSLEQSHRPMQ